VPFDIDGIEKVLRGASGVVLLWSYFDDDGLQLDFWQSGRQLGQLAFAWGPYPRQQPGGEQAARKLLSVLVGLGVLATASHLALAKLVEEAGAGTVSGVAVRDRAAAALNLAAYAWLSPHACLEVPINEFLPEFPDAEDIDEAQEPVPG
jgi:hypothetical protein